MGSMMTRRVGLIIRVVVVVVVVVPRLALGRRNLISSSSLNVEDSMVDPPFPATNSVRKVSAVSCRRLSEI